MSEITLPKVELTEIGACPSISIDGVPRPMPTYSPTGWRKDNYKKRALVRQAVAAEARCFGRDKRDVPCVAMITEDAAALETKNSPSGVKAPAVTIL